MSPKVSVIIPAFNRADMIAAAIDSALVQTVSDIEIIVVDDGSTDGTADVTQRIADGRIRVIAHERRRGAAAARNSGIAGARGEFIAFLDSDDAWMPEKLERQLSTLAANPTAEAAICGAHIRLIDQGRSFDAELVQPDDWLKHLLADCAVNPGATLVIRRTAAAAIGPMDEDLPRFEDWDWLVRHAARGGVIAIAPGVLAVVNNKRGRLGAETERSAQRFLAKHSALRARYGAAFSRRAEVDVWMQVAGTYAFAGEWWGFARVFARAALMDPIYSGGRLVRAAARSGSRLDAEGKSR